MKRLAKHQICVITTIKNLTHPSILEELPKKIPKPSIPVVNVKKRNNKVRNFGKKAIAQIPFFNSIHDILGVPKKAVQEKVPSPKRAEIHIPI